MSHILNKSVFKYLTVLLMTVSILTGNIVAQKSDSVRGITRGQAAIGKLGERLPTVAQRNGKTPNELRRLLLEDSSLYVDENNQLLYIEEAVDHTASEFESTPTAEAAPFPYANTFKLHSRPGSNRVIYLDFDGHVTTDTAWNANFTIGQPIISAPFSLDADPTTFNQQEHDAIQYIWQRVAEDFAPFDVNVTTEEPGDDAIFRKDMSDHIYGTRVVISPTNFTGNNIGGVAYLGVFNYHGNFYKPVFVITSGLGNNEKNIAEAASHEVGHNLGLSHDGKTNSDGTSSAYYSGHGNWAPIMGVGYSKAVTQWSKGEYPGANQLQDDLAVMQNYGIPLIADDHGNTNASATVLSGANISASGVITTRNDVDVFQFSTDTGAVSLNINPAPRGANLDIQAKLSDSNGNVLTTVDPSGLPAGLSLSLAAGVYYLTIDGVGAGDLTNGYSDYGSIGQYSITGTLVASNMQPPTSVASASVISGTTPLTVAFSSVNSSDPDGTIVNYAWNFGDGTTSTEANPVKVYNSAGTFTAVLTVTDNSGLTGTSSVLITATQPVNLMPVAAAGANTTSGYAPLTINFSSQGSFDPDGTISGYLWNFGDGTTSTQANPSKAYNNVGNFMVTLTVTDNSGAKSSSSVQISVLQVPNTVIYVNDISMSIVTNGRLPAAQAVVTIYDGSGKPRAGVSVTGSWSGLSRGTVSGTTNSNGQVVFTSGATKKHGMFTFTVINLSASGYTYNSSLNKETSASVNY